MRTMNTKRRTAFDGDHGLLILDDFGMERNTEYGQEIVFQVIDNRYQSRKPMIITTNLSLHTMKLPRDLEHKRIYGRILEACVPIHFTGDNLREKARWQKVEDFRRLILAEETETNTEETGKRENAQPHEVRS